MRGHQTSMCPHPLHQRAPATGSGCFCLALQGACRAITHGLQRGKWAGGWQAQGASRPFCPSVRLWPPRRHLLIS